MIINTKKGGITPVGSISISANGRYDVTEKASAVVNVPQHAKHWTILLPSDFRPSQAEGLTVVSGDSDVASNYDSDTAIAFYYHTASTKNGRYRGMAYNLTDYAAQYGFYLSTGSNSYSTTSLSNGYEGAKSIIATNNGEIKLVGSSNNYIQAGTIELYFMW